MELRYFNVKTKPFSRPPVSPYISVQYVQQQYAICYACCSTNYLLSTLKKNVFKSIANQGHVLAPRLLILCAMNWKVSVATSVPPVTTNESPPSSVTDGVRKPRPVAEGHARRREDVGLVLGTAHARGFPTDIIIDRRAV